MSKIQQQAQKPTHRPGTGGQKPSDDKIANKMTAVYQMNYYDFVEKRERSSGA